MADDLKSRWVIVGCCWMAVFILTLWNLNKIDSIEKEREKGIIHSSLEVRVRLYVKTDELFLFLKENIELLVSVFIVSEVRVEKAAVLPRPALESPDFPLGIGVEKIDFSKCARCWNYRSSVGLDPEHPQLCQKCAKVVAGIC